MSEPQQPSGLVRALGPLDATMIVIGSMIGSGIFITSAESARLSGAPGWLLLAWAFAGLLTITGALCCAELATMMPRAGGVYVFLREAYGSSIGFLYGWTLFLVIQTGTIAAVAIAFAKFLGVFVTAVSPDNYLVAPVSLGSYAISLSTELVGQRLEPAGRAARSCSYRRARSCAGFWKVDGGPAFRPDRMDERDLYR